MRFAWLFYFESWFNVGAGVLSILSPSHFISNLIKLDDSSLVLNEFIRWYGVLIVVFGLVEHCTLTYGDRSVIRGCLVALFIGDVLHLGAMYSLAVQYGYTSTAYWCTLQPVGRFNKHL
eukprot:TRINITY_DN15344_c0_g1_i2.p1 TRINITY_DN15344_c0_g1~~TRINITY_DN15344_c0_g1_i2.p1  ORF type:complete len:119 (-),score=3.53 TRINITY_DN15344_c0_g1_i2:5-361(-)